MSSALATSISPEPEGFNLAGRSLRQRTAAQLKPYSIENAKYTRTMLKNGWQGAVVAGPRVIEESAAELARKKALADQMPKDDLGGWLEFEGEVLVRRHGKSVDRSGGIESDGEDSEDGLDILEREARRKEALGDGGAASSARHAHGSKTKYNITTGEGEFRFNLAWLICERLTPRIFQDLPLARLFASRNNF